jgi:hypothetical protein
MGTSLIMFTSGSTTYTAMHNFGAIAFTSPSIMSIGNYSTVLNSFPSGFSLVDSINLSASNLRNSYTYLHNYSVANNLGTTYYKSL